MDKYVLHPLKEVLDALNTDGGHMALSLFLLFMGIFFLVRWQLPEGKELFIFAMGILAKAMNSTGKANGVAKTLDSGEKRP